jgi:hypothetical protein
MDALNRSADRVAANTATEVNRAIKEERNAKLAYYRDHPTEVPDRLKDLSREWDIERALGALSACMSLFGLSMGLAGGRRWLYLPAAVQTFYLQHQLQGWCPPLPILRRLGFRTAAEIERERCDLKELLVLDNAAQVAQATAASR